MIITALVFLGTGGILECIAESDWYGPDGTRDNPDGSMAKKLKGWAKFFFVLSIIALIVFGHFAK